MRNQSGNSRSSWTKCSRHCQEGPRGFSKNTQRFTDLISSKQINILCIANGGKREISHYLSHHLNIGDVHIVSDEEPACPHKEFHHFRECTFGRFRSLDKYSSIPLDSNILSKLGECESNVLKMMERYRFFCELSTYEGRINLYHRQVKYWYNYLKHNDIGLCVFMVMPHVVFDYVIYCVCKLLGIRTILFYRTTVLLNENISLYLFEDVSKQLEGLEGRYSYHLENPGKSGLSERLASYLSLRQGNKGKTFTGVRKRQWQKYFSPSVYINHIAYRLRVIKEWAKYSSLTDLSYRAINYLAHIKKKKLLGFANGDFRVLVTKKKIAQFGLNYQHCHLHKIYFENQHF